MSHPVKASGLATVERRLKTLAAAAEAEPETATAYRLYDFFDDRQSKMRSRRKDSSAQSSVPYL